MKLKLRHTPATPASAAQVPASSSASSFWFTPKAAAIGASCAAARIALPRSVPRSTPHNANVAASATSSVTSSGSGTNSSPSLNFTCPCAHSRRRKSALQIAWMTASMIAVRPKVTSSVFSAETLKRVISACSPTPAAKNSGTIAASATSGSMPVLALSW